METFWYCPTCNNRVASICVTYDERHDERYGGCGNLVQARSDKLGIRIARPIHEWKEEMGDVLWWSFPVEDPPYVGTPHDLVWQEDGYSGYYTHWTIFVPPLIHEPLKCVFCEKDIPRGAQEHIGNNVFACRPCAAREDDVGDAP